MTWHNLYAWTWNHFAVTELENAFSDYHVQFFFFQSRTTRAMGNGCYFRSGAGDTVSLLLQTGPWMLHQWDPVWKRQITTWKIYFQVSKAVGLIFIPVRSGCVIFTHIDWKKKLYTYILTWIFERSHHSPHLLDGTCQMCHYLHRSLQFVPVTI